MIRTKEELYSDVPEFIKSSGASSSTKSTGASLRKMFVNIIDSMSMSVSSFPIGAIVMWSGSISSIPTGWRLCNGVNGAPNLMDKFIMGAGNNYSVLQTGGESSHSHSTTLGATNLSIGQMPKHRFFTINTSPPVPGKQPVSSNPANSVSMEGIGTATFPGTQNYGLAGATMEPTRGVTNELGNDETHTHSISLQPASNIPPFMALAFIQKVEDAEVEVTDDLTPPTPPNPVVVIPTATGFKLTWGESFDFYGIERYRIYFNGVTTSSVLSSSERQFIINVNKVVGFNYTFAVQAVDNSGNTAMSNEVSYVQPEAVSLITDLSIPGRSKNLLNLKWKLSPDQNVASVEVNRSTSLNGIYYPIANVTISDPDPSVSNFYSYIDMGLTPVTTYFYRLRARGTNGNYGEFSAKVYATTKPNPVETEPEEPETTTTTTTINPNCPVEGTEITLANGDAIKVDDIVAGQELKSAKIDTFIDSQNSEVFSWSNSKLRVRPAVATVLACTKETSYLVISLNNDLVEFSDSHTHLIRRNGYWKFVQAKDVIVGDFLHSENGHIEVTKVERKEYPRVVYRLVLSNPFHLFYANGVLTHNPVNPDQDSKIIPGV